MMNQIACPGCGGMIADDGSCAGQLVGCPFCGRQFVMPAAIAPPPIIPHADMPPRVMPKRPRSRSPHWTRTASKFAAWTWVVVMGLIVLLSFGDSIGNNPRPHNSRSISDAITGSLLGSICWAVMLTVVLMVVLIVLRCLRDADRE